MSQVSANLSLVEALAQAHELTEVRNDEGILLGYVMTPSFGSKVKDERRAFYKYVESLFPEEELEKARNSKHWHSSDEVLNLFEKK